MIPGAAAAHLTKVNRTVFAWTRRARAWAVAVAAMLGCGSAAVTGCRAEGPAGPVADVFVQDVPLASRPPRVLSRPVVEPPLPPREQLEQRLAELADEAEAHRTRLSTGLAQFDVEGLSGQLTALLSRYDGRANVSVHVRDLESGHVLFDYGGSDPLIPASNQKIVTSAAALDLLGPHYTFMTEVRRDGPALYLMGQGDPLLHVDDLQAIAGLTADSIDIAGLSRLVVDDSIFSSRRLGPGYDPSGLGHAYQAPSGALSLSFNTVEVTVYPVAGRSRLAVSVYPPNEHVRVENRGRTGSKETLTVRSIDQGDTTVVRVDGRLPVGSGSRTVRRRVADPGLYAGEAFAQMLAEHTATAPLPVERGSVPDGTESIVVNESLPLLEVLDSGLAYSNNFIAEQTLRTLAWRMTGQPGDWEVGQGILLDYWAAITGRQPAVVENASGLTRQGRLTTQGLVDLIAMAHRTASYRPGLIDALPAAGEPGTLRRRLAMSGKRVRAKTGTLDRVSGLSGVITTEAGDPQLGFSILINVDPEVTLVADARRAVEDRIVMEVLTALDAYEARLDASVEAAEP